MLFEFFHAATGREVFAIEWEPAHTRGTGLIVDILRERWRHATLYALRDGPLQPGALLEIFESAAGHKRNRAIFGDHAVYRECVHRHLAELFHGGLIARHTVRADHAATYYSLAPAAAGLLDAIEPTIDHGFTTWQDLVLLSQEQRNVSRASIEPPDLTAMTPVARARARRRVGVLLFAVLLQPPWTLSVLSGLSGDPMRPTALTGHINASIAANRDVLTTTSVSRSTVSTQLGRLHELGYVGHVNDPAGRNPRRPPGSPEHASALTERGRALLDALLPAAQFAAAHDAELTRMVRAVMRNKRVSSSRQRTIQLPGE